MKIQFVIGCNIDNTIDVFVDKMPTDEQFKNIENAIYAAMDKYEEENGDFYEFDYWLACYEAVKNEVGVSESLMVKTIYL